MLEKQLEFDFMKEEHKAESRKNLKEGLKWFGTVVIGISLIPCTLGVAEYCPKIYDSVKNYLSNLF